MWTATIQSIEKNEGKVRIVLVFSNGPEKFTEEFFATTRLHDLDFLQKYVRDRIETFQTIYAFADTLSGQTAIAPAPAEVVSQEQLEREQFLDNYRSLQGMQKAIGTGLKKSSDQDYLDLTALVKSQFKPEYTESI